MERYNCRFPTLGASQSFSEAVSCVFVFPIKFITIFILLFQKHDQRSQTPQLTDGPDAKLKKLQEDLDQSKKDVMTLKKEHEEYRTEKAKNDKIIQDDYDNLRKTMEKTR